MQKMERLMAITLLLQSRGKMTAQRLAEILDVSTRTIYRDIMALSLAHVPISMDYGPGGGYYLSEEHHFESAIFTREEAVSLILSTDIAGNYSLFAGDDGLLRALLKLEAALPEEYRTDIQAAREHILVDTTAWYHSSARPAYLEVIRSAVLEAHRLDILYPYASCDCVSGTHWRCIEPHGLVFKGLPRRHARTGRWYLVASCISCQSVVTFRVHSIEALKVRNDEVTLRPDFDLRSYWDHEREHLEQMETPLLLVMRVNNRARHLLKGDFSIAQEEPEDNAIVHIHVESSEEAISYALSLGVDATVIGPSHVRDAVARAAQAIASMYRCSTFSCQAEPKKGA